LIDLHVDLFESGSVNERIHFGRGPSTHDPAFPFPVKEDMCNEFYLRMPGLIGVNEVTASLNRVG
jgi:hypothetical protein